MKSPWALRLFFLFAWFLSSAPLQAAENSYFVSVDVPHADASAEGPRLCESMHRWLTLVEKKPVNTSCALVGMTPAARIYAAKQQGYRYHFSLIKKQTGELQLRIENWAKDGETDFTQIGPWTFEPGVDQLTFVQLEIERFFTQFDRVKRLVKEAALLNGIRQSQRVTLDSQSGQYLDRTTYQEIPFDQAYALFGNENPKNKHYLTAVLELAAVLGAGNVWYWRNVELNSVDWELRWDWVSWRKKLWYPYEAITFDNNGSSLNTVSHVESGFLYYYLARENNLSILDSFLMGFAASSLWEFVGEFREKVSINDMIVTPVAGMALGEVAYQLGEFFEQSEQNPLNFVLSSIFGGQVKLHNYFDRYKPNRSGTFGRLGFTQNIWHEFSVFVGGVKGLRASSLDGAQVGLHTEIISAPLYGRPGKVKTLLWNGGFSELLIDRFMGLNESKAARQFSFAAKAALAGYYRQSIEKKEGEALQGYSFYIGAGTGYDFTTRHSVFVDESDMVGVVNVLGPVIDFVYYQQNLKIRARLQVYGDFAMVKSLAAFEYVDKNGSEGLKSLLKMDEKYYYAFGVTVSPALTVEFHDFELGGSVQFENFESIEGRDRHQSEVSNDFHMNDQRSNHKVWLGYTLPIDFPKVKLVFGLEHIARSSDVQEFRISKQRADLVGSGKLVLLF